MPQSAGASLLPRQGLCLFETLLLLAFHSISHKPLLQLRCRVFTSCDEISLSIFAHHQIKFASPPWRCVLAMLSHLKSEALGGTLQFPLYPVHFKSLEMYFSYSLQIVAPKSGSYSGRFRWDILFSQTVSSALQSVGNRIGNRRLSCGRLPFHDPTGTTQELQGDLSSWSCLSAWLVQTPLWLDPFTSLCLDLTICKVICAFLFRGTNEMI